MGKRKSKRPKSSGEQPPETYDGKRDTSASETEAWMERMLPFIKKIAELTGAISSICGFLSKNIWACTLGILVLTVFIIISLKKKKGLFVAFFIGGVCFTSMSVMCLTMFGAVRIRINQTPEGQVELAIDTGKNESNDRKELEQEDSTESPALTYVELTFEDKIGSQVWVALAMLINQIGVTGTEENFQTIYQNAFAMMESAALSEKTEKIEKHHSKAIRENVDKIEKWERETAGWDKFTEISALRAENYSFYPSMENAHQSGIAALDCLDWMGKVNGKEKKRLDKAIYNEENLFKYGNQAVDGLFAWWSAEYIAGNYHSADEICFYFGQTFHHFGGCDEMTGDATSIGYLVLSAVFYSRNVEEDEAFYKDGRASEKQYTACKYYAIVCDKLDNKLKPKDPFFLLEAETYYKYSLYNPNLSTDEERKIKSYLQTVKNKKTNRGL